MYRISRRGKKCERESITKAKKWARMDGYNSGVLRDMPFFFGSEGSSRLRLDGLDLQFALWKVAKCKIK